MSRSTKAHVLLILTTLVWGVTFVQIKDALSDISPLLFNTVRMTLAAVALLIMFSRRLRTLSRGAFLTGCLVGTFLWAGYEFQTTGLALTTPSKSAFLTGFSVILVPVFLALFWRRRVNRWVVAGVITAMLGLYLMTVPSASSGWPTQRSWWPTQAGFAWVGSGLTSINRGDLLTIGCAIFFALQIINMGRAMQKYKFEQIATLQACVAAVLMAISVPVLEHPHVIWSSRVIWAVLVTGLLGTAAAFTIQAWAQQFTAPTYTALIFLLEPVFAWITSYVVLHERLGWRAGFGALLILGGIVVSELKGSAAELADEVGPPSEPHELKANS
ncbi:MAG: DMT family transporter [Terriglobales bacterium]